MNDCGDIWIRFMWQDKANHVRDSDMYNIPIKECDITKVQVLLDLFAVSPEMRDDEWRDKFFANVVDASFRCERPQMFSGPEGFPYFSLLSPEPEKPFASFCIGNLVEVATTNGFGIAVNRRADGADWVFSYGDLVTLRLTGGFHVAASTGGPPQKVIMSQGEKVLLGAPSESTLPSYARSVIRRFMQQSLRVAEPSVFLMVRAADPQPNQLVFSVFPEDFGTEAEFFSVIGCLSWFLPRHYSITGIPKGSEMCQHFLPL